MIQTGELADRYQVLEEVGSGSFGVVYKGIEKATGQVVAIKLIDLESSEEDIAEIQGEINLLSTCASPFVTQYKASFLRGSKLWIVMEYMGGGSCQDMLKPGPLSEAHVAIICRELLLGLDYLHREGKIHRDIKAANVLLANSGRVKLADFGVAAQLNNIKSMRNTFVGTPFWMAPEVIQENGYDCKADIWSLGITAMELINGEPPHAEIHPMKVLFLIPKEPSPRLSGPRYSRELKDFVSSCLIKDPEQRPSAKDLLNHRFIKNAGRVENLQQLILRRRTFDASKGQSSHPKYYEQTMVAMSPLQEQDDWVFDTIKPKTIVSPKRTIRRKAASTSTIKYRKEAPEDMIARLHLEEHDADIINEENEEPEHEEQHQIGYMEQYFPEAAQMAEVESEDQPMPAVETMRRVSTKRRRSVTQLASPGKRKASEQASGQRKPLAPDLSFGNGNSTARLFRRMPSPQNGTGNTKEIVNDENAPPAEQHQIQASVQHPTREALLGRRTYSKVVDPALQELYAQTGDSIRRQAISSFASAWAVLDLEDPDGEYHLLKTIIDKIAADPKLSSLLPQVQAPPPQVQPQQQVQSPKPATPNSKKTSLRRANSQIVQSHAAQQRRESQQPKLVLSQANPHLKSHRRRQSSLLPAAKDEYETRIREAEEGLMDEKLGIELLPPLEHEKRLSEVLYGKWVDGLKARWGVIA